MQCAWHLIYEWILKTLSLSQLWRPKTDCLPFSAAGFLCCHDSTDLIRCWDSQAAGQPPPTCVERQVDSAGIAPGVYKSLCSPGYLWVEWKKKCLRKN